MRSVLKWAALALLGLVAAAAIAVAAGTLAHQPIGLQSQPLSAGRRLAPPVTRPTRPRPSRPAPSRTVTSPSRTVTTAPATSPSGGGDDGGHGDD